MTGGRRLDIVYFAYGSNLCLRRMRERVPSARRLSLAFLPGHTLKWHKRSVDGSGKCTIVQVDGEGGEVHGVLYVFPKHDKILLDAVEGLGWGYDETAVQVETPSGTREATTYIAASSHVDDALVPYAWYQELVVGGATSAGLPPAYVQKLRNVDTEDDGDVERASISRATLPCE